MDRPGSGRPHRPGAGRGGPVPSAVPRHPPPHGHEAVGDAPAGPLRLRRGAGVRGGAARALRRARLGRAGLDLARGGGRGPLPPPAPSARGGRPCLDRQLGRRRAVGGAGGVPAAPCAGAGAEGPRPRRALSRRRAGGPARGRRPLRRLDSQPPRARGFRPQPRDGPRPAPPLCGGAARHPHHPGLRGAGLRRPAGLRALERRGGPVPAGPRLPGRAGRRRRGPRAARRAERRRSRPLPRPRRLDTILSRHTCGHRADELLAILATLGAPGEAHKEQTAP